MPKTEQDPTAEILKDKKILVIDDAPWTRQAMSRVFSLKDVQITTANDGEEALNLLQEQPDFDLIITDLVMPYMDGLEFLQAIVDNPNLTTCKRFILQTSTVSELTLHIIDSLNTKAQLSNSGIQIDYLHKSYTTDELFSFVASSLT